MSEKALNDLDYGNVYAYDALWSDEDGYEPTDGDWAVKAARGILYNLSDRRGIKHELKTVDHDVRVEMVQTIADIIRTAEEVHNNRRDRDGDRKR